MTLLLFLFGTAAWAGESISFQNVIKGEVIDFNVSENGTALAIVENWAEGLMSPDNKELTLYRSADMGKTWEEVGWLVDNVYLEKGDVASVNDIAFLPDGTAFISGTLKSGASLFIKSADGGKRWESINIDSAPLNMEAVGSDLLGVFKLPRQELTILKISHDGGKTWSDLHSSVADYDGGLVTLDAKTWVTVLQNGGGDVTLDGGKTWQNAGIKLSGVSADRYKPGMPR